VPLDHATCACRDREARLDASVLQWHISHSGDILSELLLENVDDSEPVDLGVEPRADISDGADADAVAEGGDALAELRPALREAASIRQTGAHKVPIVLFSLADAVDGLAFADGTTVAAYVRRHASPPVHTMLTLRREQCARSLEAAPRTR